jgi:hypothetical protein
VHVYVEIHAVHFQTKVRRQFLNFKIARFKAIITTFNYKKYGLLGLDLKFEVIFGNI